MKGYDYLDIDHFLHLAMAESEPTTMSLEVAARERSQLAHTIVGTYLPAVPPEAAELDAAINPQRPSATADKTIRTDSADHRPWAVAASKRAQ
jgi:hypothetical protein